MEPQALGRLLRQSREAKELSLDDAERALRIRRRTLEAFEAGEFILPDFAPIQLRGFIRNYARWLGLDEERILTFYEEALVELANGGSSLGGRRRRRSAPPKRKGNGNGNGSAREPARSVNSAAPGSTMTLGGAPRPASAFDDRPPRNWFAAIVRVLVALAAIAVIVVAAAELLRTSDLGTPTADADPPAGDLLDTLPDQPTFTPLPVIASATPTLDAILQPSFSGQGVLVSVEITQRGYVRITADGTERFDGLARVGEVFEIQAGGQVVINAGNAEGLRIVYNGQRQPIFGDRGQRVDLTFTVNGVDVVTGDGFAPTPEFSPTPLPSPTPDAGALVGQLTPTIPPTATPDGTITTGAESGAVVEPTQAAFIPTSTLSAPTVEATPTELPGAAPLIVPTSTTPPVESGAPTALPLGVGAQPSPSGPTALPIFGATGVPAQPTDAPVQPQPTALPAVAEPAQTEPTTAPVEPAASPTLTLTRTPLPTLTETPSRTPVPTATIQPSPSAIVPPRFAAPGATPTKAR